MSDLNAKINLSPRERFNQLFTRNKGALPNGNGGRGLIATSLFEPAIPNINLLPSSFEERARARRLVGRFILVLIVIAAVFGATALVGVGARVARAATVSQLQTEGAGLTQQVQSLSQYKTYKTSIDTERSGLGKALQTDLNMSSILTQLNNNATSYNVTYTAIGLSVNGANTSTGTTATAAGGCISDPFNPTAATGCITLSGSAPSQQAITAYFSKLNSTNGFANAVPSTITNTTNSGTTNTNVVGGNDYTFSGSVSFNQAFYSNKYANLNTSLDSVLSGSAATTTGTSGSSTADRLKAQFPAVFANVSSDNVTLLSSQICSAAVAPIQSAALAARTVSFGATLNITLTSAQAATVANIAIATDCSSNKKNVTGA